MFPQNERLFKVADHLNANDGEPIRSVKHATDDAAIVAWTVKPGRRIRPHVHPSGQDTWTILADGGDYQLNAARQTVRIAAGDVVVASAGAVHGVLNSGAQALVFVSVVSPAFSGCEPL